jgi:small subunit ribosomal protein S8
MDPVADMLVAIKNAQAVGKENTKIPFSKLKLGICKILEKEGFIEKVEVKGRKKKYLVVTLKYDSEKRGAISGVKKISKPGQRIYLPANKIKPVKSGYGIAIISTSKGLLTDKEARKMNIGGEVLCEIW